MNELFGRFARWIADLCGRAYTFVAVNLVILIWFCCGPFFHYSDTWQLWINTATTLVTTVMVFVLQHTQNRDTIAMQLKLDELIRTSHASDQMQAIEDLTEDELRLIRERRRMALGGPDRSPAPWAPGHAPKPP